MKRNAYGKRCAEISARSAGVDIALWDIIGKALDMPIYQLLGGAFRLKIPAYASGLFKKDKPDITEALMDEAKGYVDAGFPAVKMKIGFGEAYDIKNVAAVRRAIGDGTLFAVDANCGYDVGTAIDVGQKILDNDIFWYEEPITTDDVVGYREIRHALKVRIAGGEMLQGRWAFRDLLQKRGLDIVQPDVSIAGGFTECRKIAAMASANYVRVLPHVWGSSIRLAATLHWQATLPDAPDALNPIPSLLEFDMTENRLRTTLAKEPINAIDGYVNVPTSTRIGHRNRPRCIGKVCVRKCFMKNRTLLVILLLFLSVLSVLFLYHFRVEADPRTHEPIHAAPFSHDLFDQVLQEHVDAVRTGQLR